MAAALSRVRMPVLVMQRKQAVLGILAVLLAARLLSGPFLQGFQRMETDFPNYYTAAKVTVQHMPLRQFYDWVWFQRQIHYAGVDHQLGGYIPHTPLTMLPLIPLTAFPPQRAKQIWLVLEVMLLAASVFLLARTSRLPKLEVLVLSLLAYSSLSFNFRLGQYYILILFLLVASFYCLLRRRDYLGGALLGLIFALKLYTAPFALYFIVRRQWKALLGFLGAVGALSLLAVAWFGWSDVWFFATTVMARGLDGSVIDPYNPGLASMTTFLRRTFIAEPELNPHPIWNNPSAFFFLRSVYSLAVLGISLVALAKQRASHEAQALAWFVIVLFVLSPNEASYTFVLLLVPIVLLLDGARRVWSTILIALYVAVELPLYPWDARLFPKAWLMLGLFLFAGWSFLRKLSPSALGATMLAVVGVAAASTVQQMRVYRMETAQTMRPAFIEPNGIYSASPVFDGDGWIYEAISDERYLLREWTSTGTRTFKFDGDAFHPAVSRQRRLVAFELAANGHSQIYFFDPVTGGLRVAVGEALNPSQPALSADGTKLAFIAGDSLYLSEGGSNRVLAAGEISNPAFFPDDSGIVFSKGRPGKRSIESMSLSGAKLRTLVGHGDCFEPAVSPDGRLLAYTCSATGGRHIWIADLASMTSRRLTFGNCNNESPAWDRDSQSIVFASDCSRGLGLTALYRLPIGLRTSGE
jgi:Glycosyltransferase family 87/WD40-like Beta Propeller Repeat